MPAPTRAERVKEHAAVLDRERRRLGVLGLLVRGREARAADTSLEVEFARVEVDGHGLPAAVWVALRRGDVEAALDTMQTLSGSEFLLEEREEIGAGYRLQAVRDTAPVPETGLLAAQLAAMLDLPIDVLAVLAEWGPDDPRAASEIDTLLTARFGPADPEAAAPAPQPPEPAPSGQLTLNVSDVASVLRLDADQERALTTLVRNAAVTITAV